jgi:hypothetical protein
MTLSRWKMMAVGLGVSLGGIAAMAGQCPKTDTSKGRAPEAPPALEVPAIPAPKGTPAESPKSEPKVELPPPPATDGVIPVLPPGAPAAAPGSIPPLPVPPAEPVKRPDAPVSSPATAPILPVSGSQLPKVEPSRPDVPSLPGTPTIPATNPAPAVDVPPSPTGTPSAAPAGVIYSKPTPRGSEIPASEIPVPLGPPSAGTTASPTRGASAPGMPPARGQDIPSLDPLTAPSATRPTPITVPDGGTTSMELRHAKPTATKYRILLRVGEGEPTFEVKCGDELVLKVICEKIDIKSPEKGSGPSMVRASGKVRFAGFGAEGVCEELSFLAGTGEVMMAGAVNIKVKDKLGRVESEFSTESAKYKLDPHAPAGSR